MGIYLIMYTVVCVLQACSLSHWGRGRHVSNFWWDTIPKRLGGEALLAPGRLGGEPYPFGVGLKILGGRRTCHILRHIGSDPKEIDVHLIGVHLIGVHLIGVHLIGVHLMGVHLMGVHLISMYGILTAEIIN